MPDAGGVDVLVSRGAQDQDTVDVVDNLLSLHD